MEFALWGVGAAFTLFLLITGGFLRYYANDIRSRLTDCKHSLDSLNDSQNRVERDVVKLDAKYEMHMWAAHDMTPKVGDK